MGCGASSRITVVEPVKPLSGNEVGGLHNQIVIKLPINYTFSMRGPNSETLTTDYFKRATDFLETTWLYGSVRSVLVGTIFSLIF